MNRIEICKKVVEICREVFEDEKLEMTDVTTATDVEGWDSLTHLSLINEIETEFGIRFTMGEIQGSKNFGELIDALVKHIEEK